MKFCPKCGRQLADGEVCNCQPMPQQGQFNSQQAMGGQFNGQPTMQPQAQQASPLFQDIATLIKGIFKKPVPTISYYVNNVSAATSCILIGILALLAGFKELIYIAGYNAKYPTSSSYEGMKAFTNFLNDVVVEIAAAAIFAVVIMVLINAFEKNHKITFIQALAVASIIDLVYVPVAIAATVINMIPIDFFGYLATWIRAFGNGMNYVLLFIGIKSIERDDNHMPIVFGCAACAMSVVTTLVNLIF